MSPFIKGILFSAYQRMPCLLKSMLSKLIFKPKKGKNVGTFGNILYGPKVFIGDYSYIHRDSYLSNISIGKFCGIGKNFSVITSNHNYKNFSSYPFFSQFNSPLIGFKRYDCNSDLTIDRNAVLGNDVWIGENVTIMRGVTIGDGAVIGANSFVNKDVPPYAVGGGSPFRIIRFRFSENVIQELSATKWWDYSPEKLYEEYPVLVELVKAK